jgi:hypothetical protein
LILVYVADFGLYQMTDCYGAAAAYQCREQIIADLIGNIVAWMSGQSISWTFVVPTGRPPSELERVAAAHDADAIIVGQPRRRRLRRPLCARLNRFNSRIVIAVP